MINTYPKKIKSMYSKQNLGLILLLLLISFFTQSQTLKNLNDLPPKLQNQYLEIKSILDNLNDEYIESKLAKKMIDAFLFEEKGFLPIYIQQVRQILKSGFIGTNDVLLHYRQAQTILDELIIKSPNYAEAYLYQGIIQTNLLQFKEAENSFERAKTLSSNDPWLFISLGRLKYRQQDNLSALMNYKKAFNYSNEDMKSLLESFIRIVDLSKKLNQSFHDLDLIKIVFKNFNDKEDRLKIARRLISTNLGRRDIFDYANKVILKQKELTPKCVTCDIETASLILASGFRYIKNNINYYYAGSMDNAEKLLEQYKDNPEVNERVFKMLLDISFSKKDLEQVNQLLSEALSKNISEKTIKLNHALVHYLNENYKSVIDVFEYLIKEDKGLLDNKMFLSAKGRYGNATYKTYDDYDGLEQYFLRQIDRYPDNAYVYGNYVSFLLGYVKYDSAAAIIYGEKGLQYMQYSLLKNDLGLAYHIEASKLNYRTNKAEKIALFKKSLSMGDKDYSKDSRCKSCTPYSTVKELVLTKKKANIVVSFDYSYYIKWLMLLLLISLIVIRFKGKLLIIKRKQYK